MRNQTEAQVVAQGKRGKAGGEAEILGLKGCAATKFASADWAVLLPGNWQPSALWFRTTANCQLPTIVGGWDGHDD